MFMQVIAGSSSIYKSAPTILESAEGAVFLVNYIQRSITAAELS